MSRRIPTYWTLAVLAGLAAAEPARAASITGTVTLTPGGQPSGGVWVSAVRLGDYLTYSTDDDAKRPHGPARTAVTDLRGTFTFRNLLPGEYEVSMRADSLPPSLYCCTKPVHTVLVSAKDQAGVDLQVTRLASFEGMTRRVGAGAMTGVRVQAFHHGDTKPIADTWTDSHGGFKIDGLERNVPIDLVASTSEGQYCRVTKTPLRAGPQPVEIALPSWSSAAKRRVELTVILPTSGERHYELDWISKPEEAPTGYRTTIALDRDGHGELDSPEGIFLVRVRETSGASSVRTWTAERYYRVEAGGTGAITAKVDLTPVQSGDANPDSAATP